MIVEFRPPDTLIITGEVKNLDCYSEVKKTVQQFIDTGNKDLVINVKDSVMITSSIIGYFTKLIHADGLKLSINVYQKRLYDLMEDLNLIRMFNVRLMNDNTK